MSDEVAVKQPTEQPGEPKRNPAEHLAAYRFKPGQSGNPAGRPPGRKTLWDVFRQALEKEIPEKGGRTRIELLVELLIEMAEGKNLKAIQEVLNRYAGKVPDVIQAEGLTTTVDPDRQERFLDDPRALELACELDERISGGGE